MDSQKYSLIVKRAATGELSVEVIPGDVLRDTHTRVLDNLSLERATEMSKNLLSDFAERGELWRRYQYGDRAIPATPDSSYIKQLAEFMANPKSSPEYLTVCETPQMLKSLESQSIKAADIRITPSVIKKCIERHNLDFDILKQLPTQLRDPIMIMKPLEPEKHSPGSLVLITNQKDFKNRPIIISLSNNDKGDYEVAKITSAYGRTGFQSWIQRNKTQNTILYENKERTGEMYTPEHLSPGVKTPEHDGSVTINTSTNNNSISHSNQNVNTQNNEILRKNYPGGVVGFGSIQYKQIPDKRYIKADKMTVEKLAETLHAKDIKFSCVIRPGGSATLTVSALNYEEAMKAAIGINPALEKRSLPFNEILSKFQNVKEVSPEQHAANCPCCNDSKHHLYIKQDKDNGAVLLDCKKGCSSSEIVAAVGLSMSDLFTQRRSEAVNTRTLNPAPKELKEPPQPKEGESRPQESPIKKWRNYNYTDINGLQLYQKSVAVREDGDKFAVWKHYVPEQFVNEKGKTTHWDKGLNGGKPPLYNSPVLSAASKIYIVEGEKDVDTMKVLGLPAVCSPHGSKWDSRFTPLFEGKDVVIITDNDEPGESYGKLIAESLSPLKQAVKETDFDITLSDERSLIAKSVTIISAAVIAPVAEKEGGDISDIFEHYGNKETIDRLNKAEEGAEVAQDCAINTLPGNTEIPKSGTYIARQNGKNVVIAEYNTINISEIDIEENQTDAPTNEIARNEPDIDFYEER